MTLSKLYDVLQKLITRDLNCFLHFLNLRYFFYIQMGMNPQMMGMTSQPQMTGMNMAPGMSQGMMAPMGMQQV